MLTEHSPSVFPLGCMSTFLVKAANRGMSTWKEGGAWHLCMGNENRLPSRPCPLHTCPMSGPCHVQQRGRERLQHRPSVAVPPSSLPQRVPRPLLLQPPPFLLGRPRDKLNMVGNVSAGTRLGTSDRRPHKKEMIIFRNEEPDSVGLKRVWVSACSSLKGSHLEIARPSRVGITSFLCCTAALSVCKSAPEGGLDNDMQHKKKLCLSNLAVQPSSLLGTKQIWTLPSTVRC